MRGILRRGRRRERKHKSVAVVVGVVLYLLDGEFRQGGLGTWHLEALQATAFGHQRARGRVARLVLECRLEVREGMVVLLGRVPRLRAAQQRLDICGLDEQGSVAVLLRLCVRVQLQKRERAIGVQHGRARRVAKRVRIQPDRLFVARGAEGLVALQAQRLRRSCSRSRLLALLRLQAPILEAHDLLA